MLQTWSVRAAVYIYSYCNFFFVFQKREYETHALYLRVIDDMKWDFSEALPFLSCHNLKCWPEQVRARLHNGLVVYIYYIDLLVLQMIPQLKLSLAQLVALRVQHTRTPLDQLKRLVSGDVRTNTNAKYIC